jgi:hypothetical protein
MIMPMDKNKSLNCGNQRAYCSSPRRYMSKRNHGGIISIHSFTGAYSPRWTFGLPFRCFLITHIQTHGRTPLDEWSASRRDLYLHRTTQRINTTNIHAPRGIRTRDPSNQAAAHLRLRPRGHWHRRWNYMDRENLLTRPPEFSANPTSRHLVANQEELGQGYDGSGLKKCLYLYFEGIFNMP